VLWSDARMFVAQTAVVDYVTRVIGPSPPTTAPAQANGERSCAARAILGRMVQRRLGQLESHRVGFPGRLRFEGRHSALSEPTLPLLTLCQTPHVLCVQPQAASPGVAVSCGAAGSLLDHSSAL